MLSKIERPLLRVLSELREKGIRSSLFLDPDPQMLEQVPSVSEQIESSCIQRTMRVILQAQSKLPSLSVIE